MSCTNFEITGSRRINNSQVTRHYRLEDMADEAAVLSWVESNLAGDLSGLPFADFSADEIEEEPGTYDLTATWGIPSRPRRQEIATAEYRFNFASQGGTFYRSLETIASYKRSGDPYDIPNFGNLMGVSHDGTGNIVNGVNVSPPPITFSLNYVDTGDVIDGTYLDLVESLCGTVNSAEFRGKAAGEIMLATCHGGRSADNVWSIEFGFSYIPNDTNIPVGDITVSAKKGHHLLWTYDRQNKQDSALAIVPVPYYAYVEKVWPEADLTALNLPS